MPKKKNSLRRILNCFIPHRLFKTSFVKKLLVSKYAPFFWRYGIPPIDIRKADNILDKIAHYGAVRRKPSTKSQLKVTLLVGTLGAGGSEQQAVYLAAELKKRGGEVTILTIQLLEGPKAYHLPFLRALGILVTSLFEATDPDADYSKLELFKNTQDLPPPLQTSYRIAEQINSLKPSILHCWLDETNIQGAIAGIITETPGIVLATRSVNPSHFSKNLSWTKRWYKILLRNQRIAIINNSDTGAIDYSNWLGIKKARIEVINNGLYINQEESKEYPLDMPPIGKENEVIIGIMRLTEEKRPVLFVKSCILILKRRPLSTVVLIGDGPLLKQIKIVIETSGVKDRIKLIRTARDTKQFLKMSDILILTSRKEGSPNVLIEAQSVGCPVLTTAAGGAVETLIHGKTGFIVPDYPRKIAQKACEILENRTLRSSLSAAGPNFVADKYSMDKMVNQTLKLYNRLVGPI